MDEQIIILSGFLYFSSFYFLNDWYIQIEKDYELNLLIFDALLFMV